jgi:hypothetical protein
VPGIENGSETRYRPAHHRYSLPLWLATIIEPNKVVELRSDSVLLEHPSRDLSRCPSSCVFG